MEIRKGKPGMAKTTTDFIAPKAVSPLPPWVEPLEYAQVLTAELYELVRQDPRYIEIQKRIKRTVDASASDIIESYREQIWKQQRALEYKQVIAMFKRDLGPYLSATVDTEIDRIKEDIRIYGRECAPSLRIRTNPKHASSHVNKERKRILEEHRPAAHANALKVLAERWKERKAATYETCKKEYERDLVRPLP